MQKIPLAAIPSQQLNLVLNGQNVTLAIYVRAGFMYLDLAVDTAWIQYGRLITPGVLILPGTVPGFSGNFLILDMYRDITEQRQIDYLRLNADFEMFYIPPAEIAEILQHI